MNAVPFSVMHICAGNRRNPSFHPMLNRRPRKEPSGPRMTTPLPFWSTK